MTYEQARTFKFNPFDLTKVWPHDQFPLLEVGRLVLDRNPENYFAQVEQSAFSPANLVPGIEASPDKMLQGRLFAYDDTHRHRLGANFAQIPVNAPTLKQCPVMHPTIRDGPYCYTDNCGGAPNYWPNSYFGALVEDGKHYREHCDRCNNVSQTKSKINGDIDVLVDRFDSSQEDNYAQVTDFWNKVLTAEQRDRMAQNIAGHLCKAEPFLQERAVRNFDKVHPDLGAKIRAILKSKA